MRFFLRVASRSARLRAAGQRASRGISRAIDANGASVPQRARADRSDARALVCGADAVVIAASNTSPSRASITRAMRTPREPPTRAKPLAMTRRVFVWGVLFGSRARDDVMWSQRGENFKLRIAQVSLLLRWDSKRRLLIP